MTARHFFLFLGFALYIVAIIFFALKMADLGTVIWLSLSMVCLIGLYVSSGPSKEK